MLLFWTIRYLDTRDKQFKSRQLWLDTDTLDPTAKAAIEAIHEMKDAGRGREILRYRHLFQEKNHTEDEMNALVERHDGWSVFALHEYFEDETGQELNDKQMAVVLTGNPNAMMFPPGTTQHDIDLHFAEKRPIRIDEVTLSPEQLNVLGYFVRDVRELAESSFYKEKPGVISGPSDRQKWVVKTAATDEEIRSFVTIFRRLYMENEPANFVKAATVVHEALQGYPLSNWVQGTAAAYQKELEEQLEPFPPLKLTGPLSFSRKRLIDVFLYTQYAHQPDERRTRQFHECLTSVGGNSDVLTWLFLTEIWKCAMHMRNAGLMIALFYEHYCQHHKRSSDVLPSVRADHPGLGTLEKKDALEARVLREKTEELAKAMWESAGKPAGGLAAFYPQALETLRTAMGRTT